MALQCLELRCNMSYAYVAKPHTPEDMLPKEGLAESQLGLLLDVCPHRLLALLALCLALLAAHSLNRAAEQAILRSCVLAIVRDSFFYHLTGILTLYT